MSSLHKTLLLTLVVSTCAYSANYEINIPENIKAAAQQASQSVKAGAASALEAIKALDNVSFADVRKAAAAHFGMAQNGVASFSAAFEQSANNTLDYIKANKANTAINAAVAAYVAAIVYVIYRQIKDDELYWTGHQNGYNRGVYRALEDDQKIYQAVYKEAYNKGYDHGCLLDA